MIKRVKPVALASKLGIKVGILVEPRSQQIWLEVEGWTRIQADPWSWVINMQANYADKKVNLDDGWVQAEAKGMLNFISLSLSPVPNFGAKISNLCVKPWS